MNKTDLVIRTAKTSDAAGLVKLKMKLSNQTKFMMREPDEVITDVSEEEKKMQSITNNKKGLFLVAELESELIGFLVLHVSNLKRIRHLGEFVLGIDKEHWGVGAGSELIRQMIKYSEENKLKRLALEVVEDNIRGISLYKKFGFVVEGKKIADHYVGGEQYLNTVIMGKNSVII